MNMSCRLMSYFVCGALALSCGNAGEVLAADASEIESIEGTVWSIQTPEAISLNAYEVGGSILPSSPSWIAEANESYARFGNSVANAGDVNGDGYDDVIVGAPQHDAVEHHEGAVYLFYGGPSGLDALPAWTAEGDQYAALFGWSVAGAGDVNNDGYSDVIVGAPKYDVEIGGLVYLDQGKVFVYYGGESGLSAGPDWARHGDILENEDFGSSVSGAGDVNNDGYSDVIILARLHRSAKPRALVFHGGPSGLSSGYEWEAQGGPARGAFGGSVSCAGDVNSDGYSDVIFGTPYLHNGEAYEGAAFVYLGSDSGVVDTPAWSAESNQANANFGFSVSSAGDVDADGYYDVIVGAPGFENGEANEGGAFVYLGGAAGPDTSPARVYEGGQPNAQIGNSVSCAGDVNDDEYSDVIVGARFLINDKGGHGSAFVYLGSAAGLDDSPAWTGEESYFPMLFGISVASAGDVNGDDLDEVIVGATRYSGGHTEEGAAFVYYGEMAELEATIAIEPSSLNLRSKGKFVSCYMELPDGYDPADIDVSSVVLNGVLSAMSSPTGLGDYDEDGVPDRMVKFNRSAFIAFLEGAGESGVWSGGTLGAVPLGDGDEVEVTVRWQLNDGTAFVGSDFITVLIPDEGGAAAGTALAVAPTPLTGTARISFEVDIEGPVRLIVYDVAGRLVRTLESGVKNVGTHRTTWDRRNNSGSRVGSGMYFIRYEQRDKATVEKVLVVR